ncbi:MAG: gliding motility-associated C-terminal domain-containing protein, partial [Ferruginibacter sp.]|nr:gliding motility-associated C-terminal domain-containing protein [Ferruginibacter sp.]
QITQTQPLQITKSNDIGCKLTSSILTVTGGTTYQWTPTLNLSDPLSDNPVASPTVTTVYYVESTSREGCALKDSIVVHVNSNSDNFYLIPSAFTPNNDGLNDCFGVKHWGDLTYLSFSIFNRWGELIFKSHNPAKCWDGRFKGKMQFAGTYVYQIYADGPCGKVFKKGTVVLIR